MANYSMTKEVIGWAGMTGCAAALLAREGFVGPEDVFDYSGRWDTVELTAGLGDPDGYAIQSAYFKPHAVCRWAHPAVDAVLDLTERHALEPAEIERVRVEGFYEMSRLVEYAPRTVVGAQFSLPFALALALRYHRVGLEEVSEANLTNPEVLALGRKVEVTVDPELARQFPAKTAARVTLCTSRGEYRATVEYPRGNPENPMTDDELAAKFRALATPSLGETGCRALHDAVFDLPAAPDVGAVTRVLARPLPDQEGRNG
jgi:2-methylcitrate dehydratase PrpD